MVRDTGSQRLSLDSHMRPLLGGTYLCFSMSFITVRNRTAVTRSTTPSSRDRFVALGAVLSKGSSILVLRIPGPPIGDETFRRGICDVDLVSELAANPRRHGFFFSPDSERISPGATLRPLWRL